MNPLLTYWSKLYFNQTPAEQALEPAIAAMGIRYRCQHIFWGASCIADFILPDHKVVIEVDDPSHRLSAKRKKDAERTRKLQAAGWRVVRCSNDEALEAPRETLSRILEPLGLNSLPSPRPKE